jgi:hypothetical protein
VRTAHLSPHFVLEEFRCRDGTDVPRAAVPALEVWCELWGEPLRAGFGPVRILSGFRTRRHNERVGGARNSFHVYDARDVRQARPRWMAGVAADVACARGDASRWQQWAHSHRRETHGLGDRARGGVGVYPEDRFVHLDTGPMRDWRG